MEPVETDPAVPNFTPYHVPVHIGTGIVGSESGTSLSLDIEHASSLQSIQNDKRSYLDKDANLKQEPIAIVGMAVNMPGAPNVDRLWEILANGSNTVEEVCFFSSCLVIHLVDLIQNRRYQNIDLIPPFTRMG